MLFRKFGLHYVFTAKLPKVGRLNESSSTDFIARIEGSLKRNTFERNRLFYGRHVW